MSELLYHVLTEQFDIPETDLIVNGRRVEATHRTRGDVRDALDTLGVQYHKPASEYSQTLTIREDGGLTPVLLSIQPEWARAILDRRKLWEYRKKRPATDPPWFIAIYASDPVQAIIGHATVSEVAEGPVDDVVSATVADTPHEPGHVRDYFAGSDLGNALRMGAPARHEEPTPLAELRELEMEPPQNFRYMDERQAVEVLG